jgi:hypothetical protein
MADFNNSSATYFKPSTDGMVMFNDSHMLKVSYYDTTMRIEIRARNADGKYPAPEKGKEISMLLNQEAVAKLAIMLKYFDEKLESYNADFADGKDCSDYKPYSVSIFTGSTPENTKIFQLSTGTVGDNGFSPEIWLHIGVDENRAAVASYCYKTRFSPVLVNYEPKTGDVEMHNKLSQYAIFDAAILNFVDVSNKSACHFNKTVVNDERLNKMENLVKAIADHLNVVTNDYNNNGNSYTSSSPFESFSSNTVQPQVIDGGDMSTILGTANYR